jgi:flagellar motor protein MotB
VATEAGAGDLFQIRHAEHRAVLVDQEWATDLIYQLLLAGGRLRQKGQGERRLVLRRRPPRRIENRRVEIVEQ